MLGCLDLVVERDEMNETNMLLFYIGVGVFLVAMILMTLPTVMQRTSRRKS
jgi:hypothetical protein